MQHLVNDSDSNPSASVEVLEKAALHDYHRNRASSRHLLGSHQYLGTLNPYSNYETNSLSTSRTQSESHTSMRTRSDATVEVQRLCRSEVELSLRNKNKEATKLANGNG